MLIACMPFQLLLGFAALRAVWRQMLRLYTWEKTARVGRAGPPRGQLAPSGAYTAVGIEVYTFDAGLQGWGGHPQNAEQQEGPAATLDETQRYGDRPSLACRHGGETWQIGVKRTGPVRRVTAHVYLVPTDEDPDEILVGLIGFDRDWKWHDDGFVQVVATGRWTELTCDVAEPGTYREIGFAFQSVVERTAYIGRFEIQP